MDCVGVGVFVSVTVDVTTVVSFNSVEDVGIPPLGGGGLLSCPPEDVMLIDAGAVELLAGGIGTSLCLMLMLSMLTQSYLI